MSLRPGRSRTGRNLTLRVAAGALVAMTAVGLLVGLLINSIVDLRNADRDAARSYAVQLSVSRTLSQVLDLETGVRGYVITGQARFLQPYTGAAAALSANSDALVAHLTSSSIEHARALALRNQVRAYVSAYAEPLIGLVARHPAAALRVPSTGEGTRRIDQIRANIRAIQNIENADARARTDSARKTARDALDEGGVVLVVLVALVVLLAYALQRLVIAPARAMHRGRSLARLLADASATLDSSLDLTRTLPLFSGLTSPDFADWCVVAVSEEGEGLRVYAGDPARLPDDAQRLLDARSPKREEQRITVPIVLRGRPLGLLVLGVDAGAFEPDDVDCAQELARRVGIAVDTAWQYAQSAATARVLQDSLLPERLPTVSGLEIASRFRPAGDGTRVGGDFYDVFPTGPGTWAILVGDVCGKGAAAAAVTAMVRYTLRAYARDALQPAVALEQLNEAMLHQSHDGRFVTIVYATLDLRGARPHLSVACGGHPPPLLLRAGAGALPLKGARGTLIGVFEQIEVAEISCELNAGDAIVLYSDGVTEARRGAAFTPEELAAALHAQDTADALAESIDQLATETQAPRQDDIAILAVRYVPS
ncbi:MAG: SpoIIE family protein phosphatase [Candidatus Eremiobacteraeota bacterium]|nr:SpoIIE family protein phosphatase [Candidatus Eremiobacteraeota bacterium]